MKNCGLAFGETVLWFFETQSAPRTQRFLYFVVEIATAISSPRNDRGGKSEKSLKGVKGNKKIKVKSAKLLRLPRRSSTSSQ